MTSPVGHSLGGYIFAGREIHRAAKNDSTWVILASGVLIVFSANAPDLDFLVGAALGDFNGYHHRASHSIVGTLIFTAVMVLVGRMFKWPSPRLAIMGGLAYASHLMLDLFTRDSAAPFGMQLFWPMSEQFYIAPQQLFLKIDHGGMSSTMIQALPSIFSRHNLFAVGLELAILGPIALIVYCRRQRNKTHETNT